MTTASSVTLPFAIGDTYWLPKSAPVQVEIPCPVCCGKRRITVILGDGEHVSIPCDACGHGWEGPRGFVSEYRYDPGAQQVTIDGVDSMREGKWRVSTSTGVVDFEQLHATEAEALARSAARAAEWWEGVMASHCRKRSLGNAGWTVRYHRQQISELKKKLAWHEEKVQAAK